MVWREQEPFERAIAYGEAGEPVVWLQTALADLGFYQGGAGGVFDRETRDALIEFQLERRLEPDGTVGPLTRMTLYDALERYELPRLDAAPSPDEWAASREGDQG